MPNEGRIGLDQHLAALFLTTIFIPFKYALPAVIGLSITIGMVISLAKVITPAPVLKDSLPLMASQSLPNGSKCTHLTSMPRQTHCRTIQDEIGLVDFIYEPTQHLVRFASYGPKDVTLSILIENWGAPDSQLRTDIWTTVFWGKRSARLLTPLMYDSQVKWVDYYADVSDLPEDREAWQRIVLSD